MANVQTTKQLIINTKLINNESLVDHVIGYYISVGNQFCPSLKIPIFEAINHCEQNTIVLIDYLGSAMWINVHPSRVFIGSKPALYGKYNQRRLEDIKFSNKS